MWKKFRKIKTKNRKELYNRAAKTCKEFLEKHEKYLEHKTLKSADLGKFYKFVNSKLCSKTGIGPLQDEAGKYVLDDHGKASLLNDFFTGVGTVDDNSIPLFFVLSSSNINDLECIHFFVNKTYKCLSKLKANFSAGPDGVPPILYKKLSRCLFEPLTLLNRRIFSFGSLPSMWKKSIVIPLFKKGRSSDVSNYRPISVTCIACTIFETSIKEGILLHMCNSGLLNSNHHGFIAKHSTCTNLLESLND